MTGCNNEFRFIINEGCRHIELRTTEGTFVRSICCPKCLSDLEKAIAKYKVFLKKRKK